MRPILATAVFLALGACGGRAEPVRVEDAWVRMAAVQGRPAAGYFTVTAHDGDVLEAVAAPPPARIELHDSRADNGRTSMRPLARVALPAGEPVRFEPGGKHLMIFGLDPATARGGKIGLVFRFANTRPVEAEAKVIAAGGNAPHGGH